MDFNDDENIEWLMESSKTVEKVVENDEDFEQREQESLELCQFLQVLRACFENEPILVESKAKGTVKSEEEFQKLMKRLKCLGYFFSVRTSEKKLDRQNCKLMIVNKRNPPSSHPYRVISHSRYYCSQKSKEKDETVIEKPMTCRRFATCKATMDIRQVEIFSTVCLPTTRRKRIEVLRKFRRSLSTNCQPPGDIKYGVVISLPKTHNHPRGVKGQYLNDEVKAAMHYVLRSGTTSVEGIQEKVYEIVDREFENDSIKPSRDNTAFYPNQKTIYNHLRRDGLVMKKKYRKNSPSVKDLKVKTSNLLSVLIKKLENCNDRDMLCKVYRKIQIILSIFENSEGAMDASDTGEISVVMSK